MKLELSDEEIEFILEAMKYGKLRYEEKFNLEKYPVMQKIPKHYVQKKQEVLEKYASTMGKLKEAQLK